MRCVIEFEMDNAAFEGDPDQVFTLAHHAARHCAHIAQNAVAYPEMLGSPEPMMDNNGNTVGTVRVLGD